jgi:branched-chain amino acid transport system permease protein
MVNSDEITVTTQREELRAAAANSDGGSSKQPGRRGVPKLKAQLLSGGTGWLVVAVILVLVGLFAPAASQGYLTLWMIYSLGAVALTLLTGLAGLASIGNAAFLAIGAFSIVVVPASAHSVWTGMLFGGICGAVVGLLTGLPALRLRGLYLAVSTLGLQYIVSNGSQYLETETGHLGGYIVNPPVIWPGVGLEGRGWYLFLLGVLAVFVWVSRNLIRSHVGRSWLAVREIDSVAGVFGVRPGGTKLGIFVLSSGMVGIAGALLAFNSGTVTSDAFPLQLAIEFVLMIILGGIGSLMGAVAGAGVAVLVPYLLAVLGNSFSGSSGFLTENALIIENGIFGILIVVVLLFYPGGVAAAGRALLLRARRWTNRRQFEPVVEQR